MLYSDVGHPNVLEVVPTFDDAFTLINGLNKRNEVDSVWIMGGTSIYQVDLLNQISIIEEKCFGIL